MFDDPDGVYASIEEASNWVLYPDMMATEAAERLAEQYGAPLDWPPTRAELAARVSELSYLVPDSDRAVYCGHCGHFTTSLDVGDNRGGCPHCDESDRFLPINEEADRALPVYFPVADFREEAD